MFGHRDTIDCCCAANSECSALVALCCLWSPCADTNMCEMVQRPIGTSLHQGSSRGALGGGFLGSSTASSASFVRKSAATGSVGASILGHSLPSGSFIRHVRRPPHVSPLLSNHSVHSAINCCMVRSCLCLAADCNAICNVPGESFLPFHTPLLCVSDDDVGGQGPDGKGGTTKVFAPSTVNRQARHSHCALAAAHRFWFCPEKDRCRGAD